MQQFIRRTQCAGGSPILPTGVVIETISGSASCPLTSGSVRTDNGRYQACVAVTALAGEKTRSQRFLDLEEFATEADEHALAGGQAWVDAQTRLETAGMARRRSA